MDQLLDIDNFSEIDPDLDDYDYMDEAIVFLCCHQRAKMKARQQPLSSEDHRSEISLMDERDQKYIAMFNWIVLSLVCCSHADVAAVTAHKRRGRIVVYWTKKAITQDDMLHVNEFAQIVRQTASDVTTLDQFKTAYFELMYKNALPKLSRRFEELTFSFFRYDKDDSCRYPPKKPVEMIKDHIRSLVGKGDPLADQPDNSPDNQALRLTGKADIHEALLLIIQSIQAYLTNHQSASSYLNLCGQSWIIGRSWTFRQIAASLPVANAVVLCAGKVGEYFRGCTRLYGMMYDHRFNIPLRAFEFIAVDPPPPYRPTLRKDWYAAIEAIYPRVLSVPLGATRSQLYQPLKATVTEYSSWDQSNAFVRHAEVHLIQYLISNRMNPEVIGISEYCCTHCMEWIKKVNEYRKLTF
jgi:hypothetical protein